MMIKFNSILQPLGSVKQMAQYIARGGESVPGSQSVIRTVPPVSPTTEATDATIPETGAPFVTLDDLKIVMANHGKPNAI